MSEANNLTLGIKELMAQAERAATFRRTNDALAAAQARGVKLGSPNGAQALRPPGKGCSLQRSTVAANVDWFATDLTGAVEDYWPGMESLMFWRFNGHF